MRWILVIPLLATGAWAQEPSFDLGPVEACLAEVQSAEGDPQVCIGVSANACMETPEGSTTVGMGYCLDNELQFWDARLNAAYKAAMAAHKTTDAEMAEIGATVPSLSENLKAMQRAWIPFRDAACEYEMAQWGGGTGQGPALVGCLMGETARQALRIEMRLGE